MNAKKNTLTAMIDFAKNFMVYNEAQVNEFHEKWYAKHQMADNSYNYNDLLMHIREFIDEKYNGVLTFSNIPII